MNSVEHLLSLHWRRRVAKRTPLKIAKDNAWSAFSEFIRIRDCIRTTGTLKEGVCISCQRTVPYNGSQAGHFISGRTNAILLDEDLVHLQCYHCNIGLSGNYVEYFVRMEKLYTREEIDIFRKRKTITKKMKIDDWKEQTAFWKLRREKLISVFNSEGRWSPSLQKMLELKKTL